MSESVQINPILPAFPCEIEWQKRDDDKFDIRGPQTGNTRGMEIGLTKRELFAAMAMQGILANPEYNSGDGSIAIDAAANADALLAELDKPVGEKS